MSCPVGPRLLLVLGILAAFIPSHCKANTTTRTTSATDASPIFSATDASTVSSATDATTVPSATDASTVSSATDATTVSSATDATTGSSVTDATTGSSATDATTGSSATDASTVSSATDATTGSSVTDTTTGSSATDATTGSSATDATTGSSVTDTTTGSSATDASTVSSATDATTVSSATDATTGSSVTGATTGSSVTDTTTGSSVTEATTGSSVTGVTTVSSVTGATTQQRATTTETASVIVTSSSGVTGEETTLLTTVGPAVSDPSRVQNEVSLTLKYVLELTVCTEATEKQVKTTVLLIIVQQNEAWPGLCIDSTCTNADVTATCDGVNSKSITTVVIIEQLPKRLQEHRRLEDTLRSNGTPTEIRVLFTAAVLGNVFNLTSFGAVLDKVLVTFLRTSCTPGYILTGTECVKQEEPSSVSIGAIIGGVIGSLGVVTFIVLVVIVYRRLGRAGRRPSAGRGDEHDYSGLIATGHNAGSGHSGRQAAIQLNHMGLDLNNPGHDGQIQRPVSDYDVIGEENPNIAKYLVERPPAREHRDDPSPCNPYDTIDTCHAPGPLDCTTLADEHADEVSHPDYLSPCSPRKENEEDSQPDYLTLCSSHDNFDKVIHSDYLTPGFGLNDSDKVNHSDYLTPCPKLDI